MRRRVLGVALLVGCGLSTAESRAEECRANALPIVDPGPGDISWTTQVVRLNILPEANVAIDALGLAPVEDRIIEGIRMHVREGFAPYDFAVVLDDVEAAEANLEQLMTFDVLGDDPNRLGLLALTTLLDKDTGNVTRNEHFGPFHEESALAGSPPFGGLFVSSHFQPEMQRTWPEQADCLGDVVPALGGDTPIDMLPPEEAERVASVVAALLATSIVHETGHAVGLTADDPDRSHLVGDNGCRMDNGGNVDFLERTRLSQEPLRWCPASADYLASILPPR